MASFEVSHDFYDVPLNGDRLNGRVEIEYYDWCDEFRIIDLTIDASDAEHPACSKLSPAEFKAAAESVSYHEKQRIYEAIRADEDEREAEEREARYHSRH